MQRSLLAEVADVNVEGICLEKAIDHLAQCAS